ncbi:MAG TPA: DR2241 family protein, partial [Tepidiformaceae bacterium]|nr:DR2241 family protein [Tepidiformaceae bacterium]
ELAAVDPDTPIPPGTSADTDLWNGAGRPDVLGQLRVERHPSGYLLRVEGTDAGAPGSPAQAGEAGRYDQHGRYRPLSGAPTLPPRLTAAAADDQELTNAIETIYPLALHHRALARNGELRVVAVEDVLQRQSGRYAVARSLGDPGRSVAAQTLCDAHCLRTPVWQPPGCDAPHDAIGANIPCPEPCSVFVSLCREAALWEKERPDPAPVDDTVPFAAFDVPGNEIREKYLALRFGSSVSGNG